MLFSEKLNFLLNLTNTPNNLLARHLTLDPSYISRLRHGERSTPHEDYLRLMAAFFSKRCSEEYLLSALAAAMDDDTVKQAEGEHRTELLFIWLNEKKEEKKSHVQTILSDLTRPSPSATEERQTSKPTSSARGTSELQMFYGMEGRRQATLALFRLALAQPEPGSLLLFSDENSKWMQGNSGFFMEWESLLWRLIRKGTKVKVIHKVSRDIDEMLEVIHQWLPFYTSGAVEPYYYPRLRDGVYKRTLSVVPGKAAIFATSIGDNMDKTTNFMSTDSLTVDSFTNEFYSYLSLCRPLMHIHADSDRSAISDILNFQIRPGRVIAESDSLPLITMPTAVAETFSSRSSMYIPEDFVKRHRDTAAQFEQKLQNDSVFHIMRLATSEEVASRIFRCGGIGFGQEPDVFYRRDEYRSHLENIIRLLDSYDNYHVIISPHEPKTYSIYCNEESGVMVYKENTPPILFEITEENMKTAFWEFISHSVSWRQYQPGASKAVIEKLRNFIYILEQTEGKK